MARVDNPFDLLDAADAPSVRGGGGRSNTNSSNSGLVSVGKQQAATSEATGSGGGGGTSAAAKKRRNKANRNKSQQQQQQQQQQQEEQQQAEGAATTAPAVAADGNSSGSLAAQSNGGADSSQQTHAVPASGDFYPDDVIPPQLLQGNDDDGWHAVGSRHGGGGKGGRAAAGGHAGGAKEDEEPRGNGATSGSVAVEGVTEAEVKEVEEAARKSGTSEELRLRQWGEWTLHPQLLRQPEAAEHFRKVFLSSQALELTLQSCLDVPLHADHLPQLQSLLGVYLSSAEAAQTVAQLTLDLAQAFANKSAADAALLQGTKRALASAITVLKSGSSGWAVHHIAASLSDPRVQESLQTLNHQASALETLLQQQQQQPQQETAHDSTGDVPASVSDRASRLRDLVGLSEKRVAVLLSSIYASDGSSLTDSAAAAAAGHSGRGGLQSQLQALHRVQELTALIVQRKKSGPPRSTVTVGAAAAGRKGNKEGAGPVKATPAQQQQQKQQGAVANGVSSSSTTSKQSAAEREKVQQQLAALDVEAAAAQSQLEQAEAEVQRLREMCSEIQSRRRALEVSLEPAVAPAASTTASAAAATSQQPTAAPAATAEAAPSTSAPISAASAVEQHQIVCAHQLGVAHALEAVLLRPPLLPSPADAAVAGAEDAAVSSVVAHAVTEHLRTLASLLQAKLELLHGAGQRLRFCKEKIHNMQAERNDLLARGRAQLAAALAKPLESVEGLHKRRKAEVEAIVAEAEAVEGSLQKPHLRSAVALLPPLPPIHSLLQQIGATLHQIRCEHAAILSGQASTIATTAKTVAVSGSSSTSATTTSTPAAGHAAAGSSSGGGVLASGSAPGAARGGQGGGGRRQQLQQQQQQQQQRRPQQQQQQQLHQQQQQQQHHHHHHHQPTHAHPATSLKGAPMPTAGSNSAAAGAASKDPPLAKAVGGPTQAARHVGPPPHVSPWNTHAVQVQAAAATATELAVLGSGAAAPTADAQYPSLQQAVQQQHQQHQQHALHHEVVTAAAVANSSVGSSDAVVQ